MSITEKTIAYSLTIKGLGTSRKVEEGLVTSDAQPDRLRVSKKILQSEELDAVRKLDRDLRAFVRARAVPYIFKSGIHLVPVDYVTEIDERVEADKDRRRLLVAALAGRAEEIKESDRAALGSLFDEDDYLDADRIVAEYQIETKYISLDVPGSLKALSKAVFDRERARIEAELRDAGEAIRQVQRAQLAELVTGLVDRLRPGADGRKRTLKKGGPLDQMTEFLDRYGKLNVTDDEDLARLVEQAKAVLCGVDVEMVRSSEATAARVAEGMGKVLAELTPLVETAPRRRFRDVG